VAVGLKTRPTAAENGAPNRNRTSNTDNRIQNTMCSGKSVCVVSKRCILWKKPLTALNVEECDTSGDEGSAGAGDKGSEK
jgi:hypothetical protein